MSAWEMVEGPFVFVLLDFLRYETGDSEEPRIEAIYLSDIEAQREAGRLNGRTHPAADLGYAYDYRVKRWALS